MLSATPLLTFVLLTSRLTLHVHAAVVSQDLHIQNVFMAPDGFNRSYVNAGTVVSEGQFPAPLISGNMGDQFLLNVIDELSDDTMNRATSIHWHGLFQHTTAEMDGPAFVTQCPIIPGNAFLYNFTVPNQAGTYWYHSHLATQYCDGLRGPLVLYDPNDPLANMYDIDDASTVITLADWYHTVSPLIAATHAAVTADSTLINGFGRYKSNVTGEVSNSTLAVIRGQVGKRHRFRIVSTSCDPSFTFSIDGHNMTIIEADGIETQPLTVDQLTIYAAQRYSVIVTMDQDVDNYWIRAIPSAPAGSDITGGINAAILRYDGAPVEEPTTDALTDPLILDEANLVPLVNPGAPGLPEVGGVDQAMSLSISFANPNWEINGTPFVPPSVPVLLQILSGTTDPTALLPAGSVIGLQPNKTYEINFDIEAASNHPFHLHGHTFDVVRVAGSSTYNFANPVRRDTVSTGTSADNVTIRFTTDNPGPWFLHCHIDWHLDAGLAVVLSEDTADIPTIDPPNSAWQDLCPSYNNNNPDSGLSD